MSREPAIPFLNLSPSATGIELTAVQDYEIDTVRMFDFARGVVGRGSHDIRVLDCTFDGPQIVSPAGGVPLSLGVMGSDINSISKSADD